MKKCPYCGELVQDEAILCRFCQKGIPNAQSKQTELDIARFPQKKPEDNLAGTLYIVASIIGTLYALWIVSLEWGFVGAVIAFFVFPVALIVAPLYAIVVYGAWWPAIVVYGMFGLAIAVGAKEK